MPQIRVVRDRVTDAKCDVLAVPVYKDGAPGPGTAEVERALGVTAKELFEQSRLKGEVGDALAVPTLGRLPAKQVLLVGLGERAKAGPDAVRRTGAVVARRTGAAGSVAAAVPQGARGVDAAGAFVEGYLLGQYRFDRYRTNSDDNEDRASKTKRLDLLAARGWDGRKVSAAIRRAEILAEATSIARDLTNVPAGDLTPASLAEEAKKVAKSAGLKVQILTEKELRAGKFGGILGVGAGSVHAPRMIVLRYEPPGAKKKVALVGKGITYDSGGINLKSSGLDWMKMDMAGGAAVVGAMSAIARLKPKVAVWGIVCSAENMPGPNATKPGDVLKLRGGKTVEVADTDAEGRLVLADGIQWAREQGADVIADIATLTGACVVALGNKTIGVLGSPSTEVRKVVDAAARAGESAWELPLVQDYRRVLDSEIADIRNIPGRNVGGGAITAALFLKEFAGDTPWVHLDIAGPARSEAEEFELPRGGTGVGVRTLVEWVSSR